MNCTNADRKTYDLLRRAAGIPSVARPTVRPSGRREEEWLLAEPGRLEEAIAFATDAPMLPAGRDGWAAPGATVEFETTRDRIVEYLRGLRERAAEETLAGIEDEIREAAVESRRRDRIVHLELAADRDAVLEAVARVCDETGLDYDHRDLGDGTLDVWAWVPDQPEPETTWRIEVRLGPWGQVCAACGIALWPDDDFGAPVRYGDGWAHPSCAQSEEEV